MIWLLGYLLLSAVFVFGFHIGRSLGYSQGVESLEVARATSRND